MSFLSGFWDNLWGPMYEALFGSEHAGEWLNWGFWFALVVVAVIVVVYILIFCLMKPKYMRDENGNIVPVPKKGKKGEGGGDNADDAPAPSEDGESIPESLNDMEDSGDEEKIG